MNAKIKSFADLKEAVGEEPATPKKQPVYEWISFDEAVHFQRMIDTIGAVEASEYLGFNMSYASVAKKDNRLRPSVEMAAKLWCLEHLGKVDAPRTYLVSLSPAQRQTIGPVLKALNIELRELPG